MVLVLYSPAGSGGIPVGMHAGKSGAGWLVFWVHIR
jgi:hypothetical protein